LNFPPAYEFQKFVKTRIQELSNHDVRVYVTDDVACFIVCKSGDDRSRHWKSVQWGPKKGASRTNLGRRYRARSENFLKIQKITRDGNLTRGTLKGKNIEEQEEEGGGRKRACKSTKQYLKINFLPHRKQ
jgi:hypothetical protein